MRKSIILKTLEKVVSQQESRPILQCAHYENGDIVATDGHQLVKFSGVSEDTELNMNINLLTGLPDNSIYPKTDVLFVTEDQAETVLSFDSDRIKPVIGFLKTNKKEHITIDYSNKNKVIFSTNKDAGGMSVDLPLQDSNIKDTNNKAIYLNATYMLNALNCIAGLKKQDEVKIMLMESPRPFTIIFSNMQYTIAPMIKK